MKKYTQYLNYKPSNINGLGDIPTHWEVVKLKYIAKTVLGKMLCTTPIEGYYKKPYLKSKNVQWLSVDIAEVEEMYFSEKELTQYRITKNDLLLSEGGEVGKTCIWADELEECYIQNSVHKVTFYQEYNPTFYLYLFFYLGKIGFFNSIVNRVSIAHLTQEKLRHIYCIVPPLTEQTAIVTYLNRKLADIDTFIAKKQRLITLLQEQKAAMINKAVTKGLNEHIEMQNSDLGGRTPAHWSIIKLKYSTKLNFNKQFDNKESQLFKIGLEHIESKTSKILATDENAFEGEGTIFKVGDVLFGKLRPYLAKVAAPNFEGHCVGDILVITPNKDIWKTEFLKNRLLSQEFIDLVDNSTFGVKMPRASWDFIGSIKIPVPPLAEQIAIVSHIEAESARIDKAIQLIERELTLVQEYRTALIAEAVTGKIDCTP